MKTTLMTFLRVAGSIGAAILVSWSLTRSIQYAPVVPISRFRREGYGIRNGYVKAVNAVMAERSRNGKKCRKEIGQIYSWASRGRNQDYDQ